MREIMTNNLPNKHELIPNLGSLDRLLDAVVPKENQKSASRETEQLPYYFRGVCFSINELEIHRIKAGNSLSNIPGVGPNTQSILSPEYFDPLSYSFDSFLFYMRRVMDSLILYIARSLGLNGLPSSMNDLVKGIKKSKNYNIDNVIQKILVEYWDGLGEKIKGYRDQISHTAIIISDCIAFNSSNGIGLKMLLPDNPQEKSPSKISYNPGINVMGFSLDALKITIKFVNQIVERLIDLLAVEGENPRSQGIVGFSVRGGFLNINKNIMGELVPYPVNLKSVIELAFKELEVTRHGNT